MRTVNLKPCSFRSKYHLPKCSRLYSSHYSLRRHVLCLLSALVLSLSGAGLLDAQQAKDPLLQEARDLAGKGKPAEAAAAYGSWLERNAGHRDFVSVLLEAVDSQASADKSLELLRIYTPRIQDPAQRELCLGYQIDLLEMLGRTERALGLLRSFPRSPLWLYRQARLLYQQGLFEEAEQLMQQALAPAGIAKDASTPAAPTDAKAARDLQARIRLLLARVYAAQGKTEDAESLFRLLQSEFGESAAAPASLFAYYEFLAEAGREGEAARILAELSTRFPDAPELALVRSSDGRIAYAPSPGRLLPRDPAAGSAPEPQASAAPPKAEPVPQPTASAAPPKVETAPQPAASAAPMTAPQSATSSAPAAPPAAPMTAPTAQPAPTVTQPTVQEKPQKNVLVQTGSFRDPENAQYMVRDLKASGFAASVVEKTISGNLYYRVVIGPPRSLEEAQRLLLSLKNANFEGVLLFPEEGNGAE